MNCENVIIDETEALELLSGKQVFLLEPNYKRKYLPLGLAKIATHVKETGGDVRFGRQYDGNGADVVAMTTLFTYDSEIVNSSISEVRFFAPNVPIIVGGILASLNPRSVFPNSVKIFRGYSKHLDSLRPDYSIDWETDDPWDKFSFVFTSRGCPNHCAYCAVWRIESEQWINPNWKRGIDLDRPYVMISDNNLSAQPAEHFLSVVDFLVEHDKRVVFDNGFDCKFITPEIAEHLASIKYVRAGLRLAFDRIEENGIFQSAVENLLDAGAPKSQIMAYVLFNFNDTPKQAYYRARECVRLGIRPYPQMYTPLNQPNRKNQYIGKHWTKNLARAFRHYFLMAGYYTKLTFEEYLEKTGKDEKFTQEDWDAWAL